ncbi:MAG: type II toxin-antitoxin system Phd/YefM family antitoxin [Candidatus Omnitrophica bacterium]|nr:type II toxin-antitoxin system Phd/YefM family antitoxin [Candidatus Omnitrophota bacterium]
MTVYTYSNARQNLSRVLDKARREGEVLIKRQDGSLFSLRRALPVTSPLDVTGIATNISRHDILAAVRESRSR